jgi:hypothetical protein
LFEFCGDAVFLKKALLDSHAHGFLDGNLVSEITELSLEL